MNAAMERLLEMIPPPGESQARDWADIERQLGVSLPADYKQLVDAYGGGVFDEAIWLLEPGCSNPEYDLLEVAREREGVLSELWKFEAKPAALQEEGTRVLPWAYGEEGGEYLYWLIRPGVEPESWTVLINEGRGPEWEGHPQSCAQFLLNVLAGEIQSELFSELPAEEHQFDSNTNIL